MMVPRTNLTVKTTTTTMRMMMPSFRHRNGLRLMLCPGRRDHAEYWPELAIAEDEIVGGRDLSELWLDNSVTIHEMEDLD